MFHSLCCSVGGTLNVGFMLGVIIGLYMRFTVYAVQWVEHINVGFMLGVIIGLYMFEHLLASLAVGGQSMLFSGWNTKCWLHAWYDYWPLHAFHSLCCSVG